MKSFLDNLGVKRLTQNIRDWAESKFIDSDNKKYYPWEIQYLVITKQLKPGKTYKVHYSYEHHVSYKHNMSFINYNFPIYIYLTAIDIISFNKDVMFLSDYQSNFRKGVIGRFNYGYNKYANYYSGTDAICIFYNGKPHYLSYILNFNSSDSIIMFRDSSASSIIYIKSIYLTTAKSGNTINFFLDKECSIEAQGIYYYYGLGTITYLKDNDGNEATFDFINLKINDKAIITGSNNIIKSFDPANPIFINGNNNIIINSQNLNIEEDNLIYVNNVKK